MHWTRISARDGEMQLQKWESHLYSLSAKYLLLSSRHFQPVCAWGWFRLFLFLLQQIVLTLYADRICARSSNIEINLSHQSHLCCLRHRLPATVEDAEVRDNFGPFLRAAAANEGGEEAWRPCWTCVLNETENAPDRTQISFCLLKK